MLNCRFEVFNEADHFLPEDAPEKLAVLISEFIKTPMEIN
ncbi:hypothetical protein BN1221_04891 [Brenneria goodwinii]|uniref:Uncharacterized protein n=1 Tax=Brenneria goodwinii TaxID=1109412 RepID=A0A0G4K2M3_9GAMM|nr:hypothetical protein BN1221_04891 [Brenneria goodwinii]